jgi:hypothetical protein
VSPDLIIDLPPSAVIDTTYDLDPAKLRVFLQAGTPVTEECSAGLSAGVLAKGTVRFTSIGTSAYFTNYHGTLTVETPCFSGSPASFRQSEVPGGKITITF